VVSTVPTGNIDLTPTALELIGATVPAGFDGRVITEMLASGPMPGDVTVEGRDVTTAADVGRLHYELTVHRSEVGSTIYFDGTEVARAAP
jgi:arylsulfatase A-like enzyme